MSVACSRWPSTPATRPTTASTSTTSTTTPATSTSPSSRPPRTATAPRPTRGARCSTSRTRASRTTTAARSRSARTVTSTSGTGDGGGGGDPDETGQDLTSLRGKILRIDPDPGPGGRPAYTSPADNPFVGVAGADEIWSYGVRNPFRFSFDSLTGALAIGDVGQTAWEEIDYQPQAIGGGRGVNFGWDCREGFHDYETTGCPAPSSGAFTDPIFEYAHNAAGGSSRCSITGGYVNRDPGTPAFAGRYFYADFCDGRIRSLVPGSGASGSATGDRYEGMQMDGLASFGEDACGRLYAASVSGGEVARIEGATPTNCDPTMPPPPPDKGPCSPSTQLGDDTADEFRGGDDADNLTGNGGDDTLVGGGGNDCLAGGPGADRLAGSKGADKLFAGAGADTVTGSRGADRIWARDGVADDIDCGKGKKDVVRADSADVVARNCEKVHVRDA